MLRLHFCLKVLEVRTRKHSQNPFGHSNELASPAAQPRLLQYQWWWTSSFAKNQRKLSRWFQWWHSSAPFWREFRTFLLEQHSSVQKKAAASGPTRTRRTSRCFWQQPQRPSEHVCLEGHLQVLRLGSNDRASRNAWELKLKSKQFWCLWGTERYP